MASNHVSSHVAWLDALYLRLSEQPLLILLLYLFKLLLARFPHRAGVSNAATSGQETHSAGRHRRLSPPERDLTRRLRGRVPRYRSP